MIIAVGLMGLLTPVLWSVRSAYLQSREMVAWKESLRHHSNSSQDNIKRSRILIPRLDLEAIVVEEVKPSDLDRGPMHLAGTARPGDIGNCCIAAHKEKWFRGLETLSIGDSVILCKGKTRYLYSITKRKVLRANQVSVLAPTPTSTITLITCTGPAFFGRGNGRLVLTGPLKMVE
ncbi:MAG: sortase [Armatimonadota bacterium]